MTILNQFGMINYTVKRKGSYLPAFLSLCLFSPVVLANNVEGGAASNVDVQQFSVKLNSCS
ncbi:hypothetical protein [Cedecea sp. NFIX57]|uniref:hypothetical protein n=1 Tax=Cedecea sp. NFIX57 TaxID=1566286 RepID=UPI00111C54A0|nr:hypothetical protein [Cedecea sp. NFIX57]